ncbi:MULTISPECIES: response regulator [unclassified Pseudoalteromonas]|uniref:response regulator transcription factor n=1 Tax=unclassified Pseudoalteromonas TaxID=194690 RepID=UPI0025B6048C|nr:MULTISPECIES: response regulator [unclassified Pseudoalteromonas]MDN3379845.1 response regulator [Pseudoalteromonas sp. APC 3893]MDN3388185.1 response regulator [Pseudoalteromonas sp. APC 4017]
MKLLIIEDDINLASTLTRRLTKHGFGCEVAHNSAQALQLVKQYKPSHVLLDMKLGDDNGLLLIKPIKELLPSCHIVLLTGFASIATAVEAMRIGANDYLTKPVDMPTLVKALDINNQLPTEITTAPSTVMSAERVEWEHIQQVLHCNHGNISETARQLNMHRRTLQRKLQKKPVKQ